MSETPNAHRELHNICVFVAGHFKAGEIGHHNNLVFIGGAHQAWQLPVASDRQVHACVLVPQFSAGQ